MPRYPLRQWIWRAFVQSALIPLVLVESVLIAAYMLTNAEIRDSQVEYLQQSALEHLSTAALRESNLMARRLQSIESQVAVFRDMTWQALHDTTFTPDEVERERHAVTEDGVFYTSTDNGRAASFYANSTPLAKQDHGKALRLSQLDPLMKSFHASTPRIASLYFNSWDSYNRIYPFFMTPKQYPHDMVIPDYNFYYLADAKHNPERKVVWTDVYLDPAGMGWMLSSIAPVYTDDFLEGVVGMDFTVGQILEGIDTLQVPWDGYSMLVDRDGNILVLPRDGEDDFGLTELLGYSYAEAVRREVLKPKDFSLSLYPNLQPLLTAMKEGQESVVEVELEGKQKLVSWATIPQTGWKLLMVVDKENIFTETHRLAQHYLNVGYMLIAGLVLFYLLFFALMWMRTRRLSEQLADPIKEVVGMMRGVGRGDYPSELPNSPIREIHSMARAVVETGKQLQGSEAQRLEAQHILDLVMESTTESLWTIDITTLSITLSERFVTRFGLSPDKMTLSDFNQRMHPDDLERVRHLRQLFGSSQEERYEAEYRYADPNGDYVWLLSRGRVLERDADGHALRIAGTHVDITRLKQVQEELRRASLDAQAASQAKSRFLSSMSHELRTPLNAIHGFGQLIEMEAEGRTDARAEADYAREIINASRHLTSLVDDILDLSSIENRRQQLKLQPVEIGALLHGCAELVLPEAQKRQLQLHVLAENDTGLYVQADMRRIRQVILNLLSNAIKYSSPNGLVNLGYEVRPDAVRLWVEDNGAGLSPEQQANLFQPFQRLGRENSTIPGTGIGLVLSRELATLMGGEIGFESSTGRGSRFWIDLPGAASPCAVAETTVEPVAAHPPLLAEVLCVEDHPASLKVVKEVLREFAQVRGVSTVMQAQSELEAYTPALVVLDLDLPDGDGHQVLDFMRTTPRLSRVPVLVISAVTDEKLFVESRKRGAQACLSKPVDLHQLRRVAISLLGQAL
ncbi:ATP-binding protein [Ectopseudomonas mendocina]|uniref:histidine kinase n=1 Tax=Ectopseudomonas mendocina TaxID=300 RepID=A0ABZ2RKW3_ECTME